MKPPLSSEAFNKINFLFLLTGRQELQHLIENRNAISKQAVHPLNYFISKNFETCHKSYFLTHFFLPIYFVSNLWFHTFEVFQFTFIPFDALFFHKNRKAIPVIGTAFLFKDINYQNDNWYLPNCSMKSIYIYCIYKFYKFFYYRQFFSHWFFIVVWTTYTIRI